MNWINFGISLLFSFGALILAGQLIVRIQRSRPALKPILIKSERVHPKRRH